MHLQIGFLFTRRLRNMIACISHAYISASLGSLFLVIVITVTHFQAASQRQIYTNCNCVGTPWLYKDLTKAHKFQHMHFHTATTTCTGFRYIENSSLKLVSQFWKYKQIGQPTYIWSLITSQIHKYCTRLENALTLIVPLTNTMHGSWSFTLTGPRFLNSPQPVSVRSASSVMSFVGHDWNLTKLRIPPQPPRTYTLSSGLRKLADLNCMARSNGFRFLE